MLPVHIWIEAGLKNLTEKGLFYYILQKGEKNSGVVMLKISDRQGGCKLLIQQRDLEGDLKWMAAMETEMLEERKADDYIRRSAARDPDLWVIEIEDPAMDNPFETAL